MAHVLYSIQYIEFEYWIKRNAFYIPSTREYNIYCPSPVCETKCKEGNYYQRVEWSRVKSSRVESSSVSSTRDRAYRHCPSVCETKKCKQGNFTKTYYNSEIRWFTPASDNFHAICLDGANTTFQYNWSNSRSSKLRVTYTEMNQIIMATSILLLYYIILHIS